MRRSDGAVLDTFVSRHRDALYADLLRRRDEAGRAWSHASQTMTDAIAINGERSSAAWRVYQELQAAVSRWDHQSA